MENYPGGGNEALGMGLCFLPLPHPPPPSGPGVLVPASTSVEATQTKACFPSIALCGADLSESVDACVLRLTCLIQLRNATEMCQGKFT